MSAGESSTGYDYPSRSRPIRRSPSHATGLAAMSNDRDSDAAAVASRSPESSGYGDESGNGSPRSRDGSTRRPTSRRLAMSRSAAAAGTGRTTTTTPATLAAGTARKGPSGTPRSSFSESDSLVSQAATAAQIIRRDSRAEKVRAGGVGRKRGARGMSPRSRGWISLSAVTLLSTIAILMILDSFLHRQLGIGGCRMSYMYPDYIRMTGFGSEYTRLASKYNLYLYREGHLQLDDGPTGVPVLFLPGNAGSFRQIRSIASAAATQVHRERKQDPSDQGERRPDLDFFTVDFNEDFSAFHGQTVLEQAEYVNDAARYILSLYTTRSRDPGLPDPSSVIILGHSMGGIVARKMVLMPNYQPGSINTIVTIGTPHSLAPVLFDSRLHQIYEEINAFWRDAYSPSPASALRVQSRLAVYGRLHEERPLEDVILISVAGGTSDTVISSDAATLASLVPSSHGFTVFTTSVPKVWSAIDHQAALWCDQFRSILATALLDIVDVHSAAQVKSRNARLKLLRKHFLTGLEDDYPWPAVAGLEAQQMPMVPSSRRRVLNPGQRLVMDLFGGKGASTHLLPVPVMTTFSAKLTLSLLSDQNLIRSGSARPLLDVMLCNPEMVSPHIPHGELSSIVNETLMCQSLSERIVLLPASSWQDKDPFTGRYFQYLEIDAEEFGDYTFVAVVDTYTKPTHGFLIAEFYDREQTLDTLDASLSQTVLEGLHLPSFPKHPSMVTRLRLPALDSSLVAYTLKLDQGECQGRTHFAPLLRQSVAGMHESKYFVNPKQIDVNLHAGAPFIAPVTGPKLWKGVELMLWRDPMCDHPMALTIQMDLYGSLGKIVLRYRMALAAMPFAIVLLVLQIQIRAYSHEARFMSFWEGLALFSQKQLPLLLLMSSALAIYQCVAYAGLSLATASLWGGQNLPTKAVMEPADLIEGWLSPEQTLLGNRELFLWFLLPSSIFLATGLVVISTGVVYAALYIGALMLSFLQRLGNVSRSIRDVRERHDEHKPNWTRKLLVSLFLCFLVAVVVPFQFAFMVCVIVQLITSIRTRADVLTARRESRKVDGEAFARTDISSKIKQQWEKDASDRFNYSYSMLIFLLWLTPSTAPVLVVWLRNLSAHWLTPFNSDHDLLSVAPFILFVEANTSGRILSPRSRRSATESGPRTPGPAHQYFRLSADDAKMKSTRGVSCDTAWHGGLGVAISEATLFAMAFVTIVWGVRHTYLLYPMATAYIGWTVFYQLTETYHFTRDSDEQPRLAPGREELEEKHGEWTPRKIMSMIRSWMG